MKYRGLGRTGWKVSQIGIGTWQLGGTWGDVSDHESIRTLHHAWEQGINFIDTAAAYGQGRSEGVIGQALKQWKGGDKLYVATKVTPPVWNEPIPSDQDFRGRFPKGYIRKSTEESLKRLNIECIDLMQLHTWLPKGAVQLDWLEELLELKLEGKIDRIGVSLRDLSPHEGVEVAHLGLVDSIQVVLNLFEQEPERALLPATEVSDTGVIARVPLDSGALTHTWCSKTWGSWSPADKRKQMYSREHFDETIQRVDGLNDLAQSYGMSLVEMAFRYCLSQKSVCTIIPGMRNIDEVNLNIPYADASPLPDELLKKLAGYVWRHSFYGNTPKLSNSYKEEKA